MCLKCECHKCVLFFAGLHLTPRLQSSLRRRLMMNIDSVFITFVSSDMEFIYFTCNNCSQVSFILLTGSWITCLLLFQLEDKVGDLLLFISLATMLVSKASTLGSKEEKIFIHNHLAFTVKYHRDPQIDSARIVGFEVKPYSIKHEYEGKRSENTCLTSDPHKKRTVVNSNAPQQGDYIHP